MIHRDPGLQPQRTLLAWSRTGLAVLVNAIIVLRTAVNGHDGFLLALGLGLLLASGIVGLCAADRSTALRSGLHETGVPWRSIVSVTVVTLTAAAAGILCMLAS
ncbi:DUF202 domain-containing protein [Noviherbaspirillum sp. 1P10PC]|uniref:DUF202 domain-containing protein n=1 Tax=Noviherbaspirillum sp. 1P10PC TaxID=3132292 RepID=UPI00399F1994